VPVTALRGLGIGLRPGEVADLLHLWSAVGHLLGVATELLPFGAGRARRLSAALDAVLEPPDAASRRLVEALVTVYAEFLPPLLHVSPRAARELVVALIHRVHGPAAATSLGLDDPARWTGPAFAGVVVANRAVRTTRRVLPGGMQRAAARSAAALAAQSRGLPGRPLYRPAPA
jgi:hypothetical protein